MNATNILAGLGGAIVLTILNETLKNVNGDMPRIDLVGEEAVEKTAEYFGLELHNKESVHGASLVGDLVSNTAYFSLIDGEGKALWVKAAASGILAGLGAVTIPGEIGLDDAPIAKKTTTKVWTVGYYLAGALATAALIGLLKKYDLNDN